MKSFKRGLKSGIPIGLGYLPVSFSFGIIAVTAPFNLYWWQALLISMTTLTSAGQLAGIRVMLNPAQYLEMLISQITINIRYSFMSISLSQKTASEFKGFKRWLLGFFMTDEVFAVASVQNEVSTKFFMGLAVAPYLGWTLGTLFGSCLGNILPENVMCALSIGIYAMFIAIVAPIARKSLKVLFVVAVAVTISCILFFVPWFDFISDGLAISISAIISALLGAFIFPMEVTENE